MSSRISNLAGRLPLYFGLFLAAATLHAQSVSCSDDLFQGTYFYSVNGSVLGTNLPSPYAELGKLVADGQGGVTGSSVFTQNGVIANLSFTGTYTLLPSCAGTMTLTVNSQVVGVNVQLQDNGQNVALAWASPTQVIAGRAFRSTPATTSQLCSNGSLAGAFGYVLTGMAAGLPYTEEGQFTSDGVGNVALSSVFNRSGALTQFSGNGTYSLAGDCTGTVQLSTQAASHTFRIAYLPGSRTALFLETDAGTVVTGTAQPTTLTRAILPDFISGGGFNTTLYFTNQTDGAVAFTIYFIGDDGNALTVPAIGSTTANVSMAAHGTAVLDILNTGTLVQGYVSALLPPGVAASGLIRQTAAGKPDAETAMPFTNSASTISTIFFDDTGALATAVALVNPSPVTATIAITARDLNGNQIGASIITLGPQAKTEALLRNLAGISGAAGLRGSVDFKATVGNVAVLALRFDGLNFSSIPTANR